MDQSSKKSSLSVFFLLVIVECFVFVFETAQKPKIALAQSSQTGMLSVEPSIGSSNPDQAVIFKSQYFHSQNADQIKEADIWFDRVSPNSGSARVYSSAHGHVIKEGSVYKFYGERYTGGANQCAYDIEPRHCYQNYALDVGGFSAGSNSWIYFNHDENIKDTTSATDNTIGRYRVKAVRTINANTLEVEWEFVFGRFFTERELEIYLADSDFSGKSLGSGNGPYWHQAGSWRVGKEAGQILFAEDFENSALPSSWQQLGGDGQIISSQEHSYKGQRSVKVETAPGSSWKLFQKDFGEDKQGKLTIYFWDDMSTPNSGQLYLTVSNASSDKYNLPTTNLLTLAIKPSVSADNYIYQARLEDFDGNRLAGDEKYQWLDTKVKRTAGWHKAVFWITPVGAWAEIDDFEKGIFPKNLSTLDSTVFENDNRRAAPMNWEMNSFRHFWAGSGYGSKFFIDNIVLENLPSPPDVETAEGSKKWVSHWSNIYLDSYEEIGMWNNYINWTNKHASFYLNGQPQGAQAVWWYLILSDVASNHYYRYRQTGLNFDKQQANKLWQFILSKKGQWLDTGQGTPHASTSGSVLMGIIIYGWEYMPDNLKIQTWEELTKNFDWASSPTIQPLNIHIGDSSGEDYAHGMLWGGILGSVYFSDNYNAGKWQAMSRAMAMRTFSDNPNEACETCPGGKVGIRTVYAPGVNMQDCPNEKDERPVQQAQDCLCKGDRATLPADHDFSYLFDNHDYHPHANYGLGSMSGMAQSVQVFKLLNINPIPREYLHNLSNVWYANRQYVDYKAGLFKKTVGRLRSKQLCDNGVNGTEETYYKDRGPYLPQENMTARTGKDDWGGSPAESVAQMQFVKAALGEEALNYQGLNLLEHAKDMNYWKKNDYINQPVKANIYFSDFDLSCTWLAPHCLIPPEGQLYIANRLNANYNFFLMSATLDPNAARPFKVCEENLFKQKTWEGALDWQCDKSVKQQGEASIKLTNSQPSNTEAYSPLIKVKPNQNYKVSYFVKTNNVQQIDGQTYGRIVPAQYTENAKESDEVNQNKIDGGFSLGENLGGVNDWTKKEYTFKTADNVSLVRLRAMMGNGKVQGTAWFDDIKIEQTGAIGDFDGDGDIDKDDFFILLSKYSANDAQTDLNSDNISNNMDLGKLLR